MTIHPHGTCHFTQLTVVGGSMVFSSGVTPSAATIYAIPDPNINFYGPLAFSFGSAFVQLQDCMVDSIALIYDEAMETGFLWELVILDRRWRWRHGEITGRYNVIEKYGGRDETAEYPAWSLATLLLEAMGETNYDISAMPDDVYPPCEWDKANPAAELARLAEMCGCVVVLQLDNTVKLWKLGEGIPPPASGAPIRHDAWPSGALIRPATLKVVGPPTLVDCPLRLRAIGRDTDGSWDFIYNLSWLPTPPGDYYHTSPITCGSVAADQRRLAVDTLFRYYQICGFPAASGEPNGIHLFQSVLDVHIDDVMQLLPILPDRAVPVERLHFERSGAAGDTVRPMAGLPYVCGPAWNYGYRWGCHQFHDTYSGRISAQDWTLLHDRGLVVFHTPMVTGMTNVNYFGYTTACEQLLLVCSFHVRQNLTDPPIRYERERSLGVQELGLYGAGTKLLFRNDLQRVVRFTYTPESVFEDYTDNQADIDAMAETYLDLAMLQYEQKPSLDLEYPGIVEFSLNGRIRQVYWQTGNQRPALTRVGDRAEFSRQESSEKTRRRREQVDQLLEKRQ